MQEEPLFMVGTHVAEAARAIFAAQLATIKSHEPALLNDVDVIAVHETRKAIRRTFTAFDLFEAYFEPGLLRAYRRQWRKLMRRLARCRDTAVFLDKLRLFAEANGPQPEIDRYWQAQKTSFDDALRHFWRKPKRQAFLQQYAQFTGTSGLGVRRGEDSLTPIKVGHLAPIFIYRQVAAVLAYDDHLSAVSLRRLHRLRIQCKELRYTLEFFRPLLGPNIEAALVELMELQELLGNLNDATVALELLDKTPHPLETKAVYRAAKEAEIERLVAALPELWAEFDSSEWRGKLAAALGEL